MAAKNVRRLITARKTPKNDPVIPLWRSVIDAQETYNALSNDTNATFLKIPEPYRCPSVQFQGKPYFSVRLIEKARDEALSLNPPPDQRAKIMSEAENAVLRARILGAASDAAERAVGLPALERQQRRAEVAMDKAESALIAHGFKSPAAVVAGLHLACRSASCDDLYNYPLAPLRKMAEPMLAAVPADLAAGFLADWPAKAPKAKEGAK